MILISTLHSCKRILLFSFLILLSSATLVAQVKIKEKIVLEPNNAITTQTNDTSGIIVPGKVRTSPTLQSLDTAGTIVTVTYSYRACEGFGIVKTTLSPCDAYHDSAIGNTVNNEYTPGKAIFKFVAYDKNPLKPYRFQIIQRFSYPPTCIYSVPLETLIVTDNRGTVLPPAIGPPSPFIDYQPNLVNICTETNPQPQTLDTTSFEIYDQGDRFVVAGFPDIIVNNCGYKIGPNQIRFGLTMPLWYVNMDKTVPFYNAAQEIQNIPKDPAVCLDNTNPTDSRWMVRFKTKMRIPIFYSLCPPGGNYSNLGGDSTVWQNTITSCPMYKRAKKAMEYWRDGNYVRGGSPPYHYYFDSMVMAHENTHLEKLKDKIEDAFNKAYLDIFNNRPSSGQFPCAKNVVDAGSALGSSIPNNFNNTTRAKSQKDQNADELNTDNDPRTQARRKVIFDQFISWGRSKGWADQNGNVNCP